MGHLNSKEMQPHNYICKKCLLLHMQKGDKLRIFHYLIIILLLILVVWRHVTNYSFPQLIYALLDVRDSNQWCIIPTHSIVFLHITLMQVREYVNNLMIKAYEESSLFANIYRIFFHLDSFFFLNLEILKHNLHLKM